MTNKQYKKHCEYIKNHLKTFINPDIIRQFYPRESARGWDLQHMRVVKMTAFNSIRGHLRTGLNNELHFMKILIECPYLLEDKSKSQKSWSHFQINFYMDKGWWTSLGWEDMNNSFKIHCKTNDRDQKLDNILC